MIGYIYKTTNKANNKIYVGQKKSEKFLGESYLGSGKILTQAVSKYGKNMFSVEMIDTADTLEELGEKERYWIKTLNSQDPSIGYNITPGGIHVPIEGENNGFYGKTHTDESKQKMSESHKKQPPMSQETRNKIGDANRGSHRTEETKKKMGDQQRGRKTYTDGVIIKYFFPDKDEIPEGFYPGTPDHVKQKQRDNNMGKKRSEETCRKSTETNYKRWSNYTEEEYAQVCQNMRDAHARRPKTENYWKGKKRPPTSEETKQKLSQNSKGRVWVHNDEITKMVMPEEVELYIAKGFLRGRK